MVNIVVYLVAIATGLSLVDYLYHLPEKIAIEKVPADSMSFKELQQFLKDFGSKEHDHWLAVFPLVANVLLCVAAILSARIIDQIAFDLVCAIFIASRFRSLGELGHMAVHDALSGSRHLNLFLCNVFCQFPFFHSSAQQRRQRHIFNHHPNVNNKDCDPGLIDFYAIGFVPNISNRAFWLGVFYPLTPKGIFDRIRGGFTNTIADVKTPDLLLLRLLCVTAVVAPFLYYGWYYELVIFYLIPTIVIDPQFYWFSTVTEHRWFVDVTGKTWLDREKISGRATEYPGIEGFLWRKLLFPSGDGYHFAHSFFPQVRWNYMPAVDRLLKRNFPDYLLNMSSGLFWGRDGRPSALSELRDRMVGASNGSFENIAATNNTNGIS